MGSYISVLRIIMLFSFAILVNLLQLIPANDDCRFQDIPQDEKEEAEDILFVLREDSKLYGFPNSNLRVSFDLTSTISDQLKISLTFQEKFQDHYIVNRGQAPHVELVTSIHPNEILLEYNTTAEVFVDLFIPDYVPPGHRAKISVMVSGVRVSDSSNYVRTQVVFHVMVTQQDQILSDTVQTPVCRQDDTDQCSYNHCPS